VLGRAFNDRATFNRLKRDQAERNVYF